MGTLWKVLTRKKVLDAASTEQTELGRVLNTFDLTALGVGSTLGVGVYVLAGQVAKETAGPSVVLSFLIATVASVFAGLCYAEFGARAPRAGSAYVYSYVCVGEFIAFIIGWNLILEYVIGSASVARGLSLYIDTLTNKTMQNAFIDIAPINIDFLSQYFDFFAFGISIFLSVALAFGMRESSLMNNIFTMLNLLVVVFVVIAGAVYANPANWSLPGNSTVPAIKDGGFFPFGVEGMIKGAATCFYGFVGFDCIATTGEEVRNPKRAIPISIILSLFIIFLSYLSTSTVVTMMVPYYDQDPDAPIPQAFAANGFEAGKWIVAIGGIFGLCASLFGAMFPLPRILYAMASDGIIFRFLGKVSLRFKTPVIGTLLAGVLTGLMAALFELKQLVNMMSIGTLLAYTIVAASVMLLRYTDNTGFEDGETSDEATLTPDNSSFVKQIFACGRSSFPTVTSEKIVTFLICTYCVFCLLLGLCAMYLKTDLMNGEIWAIVITAVVVGLAVLTVMSIATQPQSNKELSFKVPLVPLIPALSILINVYLMLMLDARTWIRFAVWMVVGIPTYYFSLKNYSDARNMSITSHKLPIANGFYNHGYEPDENLTNHEDIPSTPEKIEPIAELDKILDDALNNSTDFSRDSLSIASEILHEENVKADVHCADVPMTPLVDPVDRESPPLFIIPTPPPTPTTLSLSLIIIDDPIQTAAPSKETTEKEVEISSSGIPPPPPIPAPNEDDEIFIPRVRVTVNAIANVTLKSVKQRAPNTPPVDYARQVSDVAPDDNLKWNSTLHRNFVQKLDQKLREGLRQPVSATPSEKTVKGTVPRQPNGNVDSASIDLGKVKETISQVLQKVANPPENEVPSIELTLDENALSEDKIIGLEKLVVDNSHHEEHRRNMKNVLGSIKLKRGDIIQADDLEKADVDEETSGEQRDDSVAKHRRNMQNVFGSIKQRRSDDALDSGRTLLTNL